MNDKLYVEFLKDIEDQEIEEYMNEVFAEESYNEMMETEMWARG